MSAARSNKYAWIVICLASIFICSNIEASTLSKSPLHSSQPAEILPDIANDDVKEMIDLNQKKILVRSADADDNYVDDDDENENKDKEDKEKTDSEDENSQSPHPHGSHGPLGHVKILLNHVQQGGGIHALGNTIGTHHQLMPNTHHESAIETEKDRTMTNAGTGLQVLEFLGTIFGLVWGFLSNIPALFGSSSASASGGRQ
ncbi:uncharacterized protein LOC129918399 isoform X2 [Episyrphus balteatus]|uniref:uncharacterized protein LOC129918399 isoform X2 n=1 Tax=Episyrphus balteatus TaxID=286459 RepID=UPI002486CD99|nr:uncharacterized protein LOC129918399 isoform X2 [Episyrphus balteatus]